MALVAVIGGGIVGSCEDAREEDRAEAQIADVGQLAVAGKVEEAATLLLATFDDYRRSDALDDDGPLWTPHSASSWCPTSPS